MDNLTFILPGCAKNNEEISKKEQPPTSETALVSFLFLAVSYPNGFSPESPSSPPSPPVEPPSPGLSPFARR